MIHVLDPYGTAASFAGEWCQVFPDARSTIIPEGDKNTAASHGCVDTKLRELVTSLWANGQRPLFRNIFIETATRCNATCSFCPNNRYSDPRLKVQLDFDVQRRIAAQLQELRFDGTIHLFCNNEPTLDRRLSDSVELFRKACPDAEIKIVTNGITLSVQRALALFEAGLDVLMINSYSGTAEIPRGPRELMSHAEQFANYTIRISVRDADEILTSRAGSAPNKPTPDAGFGGFCALPFTDLVISAFGSARLCCFDAVDETDMGDAGSLDLVDIWYGKQFDSARTELMRNGRANLRPCGSCDFDGYRWPMKGVKSRAGFCGDGADHE